MPRKSDLDLGLVQALWKHGYAQNQGSRVRPALRTLSCVGLYSAEAGNRSRHTTPRRRDVHDAVTCMSCHHERVNAKDACTQCHTSVTDPKSRFWQQRQSICVPGQTKVGAICRSDVLK